MGVLDDADCMLKRNSYGSSTGNALLSSERMIEEPRVNAVPEFKWNAGCL